MIAIHRLNPDTDRELYAQAYEWEVAAPQWFRDADTVFGPPTLADFLTSMAQENRATFGIFDGELAGLIMFTLRGNAVEVDLMARPHVARETIIAGTSALRDATFADLPISTIFCWVAQRNIPTRRLCGIIGFRDSGLRILKGVYRDRVIEWHQLIITRELWAMEQLAIAA